MTRLIPLVLLCCALFAPELQAQTTQDVQTAEALLEHYLDPDRGASGYAATDIDDTHAYFRVWLEVSRVGGALVLGPPPPERDGAEWLVCDGSFRHGGLPVEAFPVGVADSIDRCEIVDAPPLPDDVLLDSSGDGSSDFVEPVDTCGGPESDVQPSDCNASCSTMRAQSLGAIVATAAGGGSALVGVMGTGSAASAATTLGSTLIGSTGVGYVTSSGTLLLLSPWALGATLIVAGAAAGGAAAWIYSGPGCGECGVGDYTNWVVAQHSCYNFNGCYCGQNPGRYLGFGANSDEACCAVYGVDRNGNQGGCTNGPDEPERPEDPVEEPPYTGSGPTQSLGSEPAEPASSSDGLGSNTSGSTCDRGDPTSCPSNNSCWTGQCTTDAGTGYDYCVYVCVGDCTPGSDENTPEDQVTCDGADGALVTQ